MKSKLKFLIIIGITLLLLNCNNKPEKMEKIVFLHHSTGQAIWYGGVNKYIRKLSGKSDVKTFFKKYNRKNNTNYSITEQSFPKGPAYSWKNNPYDYYNIWVKNSGDKPFLGESTLEMLTKEFNIIVFKHCYPISNILEDTGKPDIDSEDKRIENYKLQYDALKVKMHEFPNNKFILWTPAVKVKNNLTPEEAKRTRQFHQWIINEWNTKGDNIFVWDFYSFETDGGLYLKDEYSVSSFDSHPNRQFAERIAPLFSQFIIDVIENRAE